MPAKSVRVKPGFEDEAEPIDDGRLESDRDDRELPYDLPDDLDVFDEFGRHDRQPRTPHRQSEATGQPSE